MLLSLAQWLQALYPDLSFLRVFQYLTFRAVMAALTALLIGLMAGPAVIRRLTQLKIGQPVRGYIMQNHVAKTGTPTMGGGVDPVVDCLVDLDVVRVVQPVCLDRSLGHLGFWGHRLGG